MFNSISLIFAIRHLNNTIRLNNLAKLHTKIKKFEDSERRLKVTGLFRRKEIDSKVRHYERSLETYTKIKLGLFQLKEELTDFKHELSMDR